MRVAHRQRLPLEPLLRAYTNAGIPSVDDLIRQPGLGSRFRAVLAARVEFLNEAFLDNASESEWRTVLCRFYRECIQPPLHVATLTQRASLVRHALGHLLRGSDSLAERIERCLHPGGPYFVAGLGPAFWSAILQGLHPKHQVAWTQTNIRALQRLGLQETALTAAATIQASIRRLQTQVLSLEPRLTALHLDHFLGLVASMRGRDLWSGSDGLQRGATLVDVRAALQHLRAEAPLRSRLKERGHLLHLTRQLLEAGLAAEDGMQLGTALNKVDPAGAERAPIQWKLQAEPLTLWIGRLWEADDPYEILEAFWRADQVRGAGLWLPAAVLHLRDSGQFQIWNEKVRQGYALLDDSSKAALPAPERYRLFNEGVAVLNEQYRLHPLEAADLLSGLEMPELVPGRRLPTSRKHFQAHAAAVADDPQEFLARRVDLAMEQRFNEADFCRTTLLNEDWLCRAKHLLELKRQLVLQGVPGTGKTHVAQALARLLAHGHEEAVRLVQFHPAFTYEEFVEGIKVRSVEVNGRQEVSYPVEEGLLCTFAAEAARQPAQPFVLIVDEINRGNLPRIFGELLYLLEYRGQSVRLPYSRREFQLPDNLYVIGTMNAADRSVALIDQALRRRFSFLEMLPDAAVLRAWLQRNPPAAGASFVDTITALFERVNARLQTDLGPLQQVGHSYFMVKDLDEARLRIVWEHQVRPLLEEYFHGQPQRVTSYNLDRFLQGGRCGNRSRKKQPEATVV